MQLYRAGQTNKILLKYLKK